MRPGDIVGSVTLWPSQDPTKLRAKQAFTDHGQLAGYAAHSHGSLSVGRGGETAILYHFSALSLVYFLTSPKGCHMNRFSMSRLGRVLVGCGLVMALGAVPVRSQEAEPQGPQLAWQKGPCAGPLGSVAAIKVPEGFVFLGANDTKTLMEMLENPVSGAELGTLAPATDDEQWLVIFEYDDTGYVKDDDKASIDADALLKSIRVGNEAGNEERRKRGWGGLSIVGWEYPPNYDDQTKNLQWAIRGKTDSGEPVVNYNTRLLGRSGVMRVTLVGSPETLGATVPTMKKLLAGFEYIPGNKYGEWQAGDRVAEYGLAALVAGGGMAVAAKTGLLAKLFAMVAKMGKFVVIAVIAVLAGLKAFAGRLFGRKAES